MEVVVTIIAIAVSRRKVASDSLSSCCAFVRASMRVHADGWLDELVGDDDEAANPGDLMQQYRDAGQPFEGSARLLIRKIKIKKT